MGINLKRITGIYELDGGMNVEIVFQYDNQSFVQQRLELGGFTSEFIKDSKCLSALTRKYLKPRNLYYYFGDKKLKINFQSRAKMDAFLLDPVNAGLISNVDYGSFTASVASLINPPVFV